jgi:hypothetical protein
MSIRSALAALAILAGAGTVAAQPAVPLNQQPGFLRTGDFGELRPERFEGRLIRLPARRSATITCSGVRYTVSVAGGSCSTFSNPDSDGNPTPADYARCQNAAGDRAIASCRHGCYPTVGTGRCTRS